MEEDSPEAALATARRAARTGGAILRSYFGRELVVREKRDADLVTEADLAAEAAILAVLQSAHPDFGIVSEEGGTGRADGEYTWLVDPLDGTSNFVLGIPQFGVSIALLRGGEAILGVVYHPTGEVLWEARRGAGARRNGVAISAKVAVDLRRAVVTYVQGYPVSPDVATAIQGVLAGQVKRVLTNWAPALDWCLLAEGKVAALVSLDSEREDLVAGALIAQEAGALLTDLAGLPYTDETSRILAAGDPATHAALLGILNGTRLAG